MNLKIALVYQGCFYSVAISYAFILLLSLLLNEYTPLAEARTLLVQEYPKNQQAIHEIITTLTILFVGFPMACYLVNLLHGKVDSTNGFWLTMFLTNYIMLSVFDLWVFP